MAPYFWPLVVTPLSWYSVLRLCAREAQIIVMIKLGITKQVAVLNHIQISWGQERNINWNEKKILTFWIGTKQWQPWSLIPLSTYWSNQRKKEKGREKNGSNQKKEKWNKEWKEKIGRNQRGRSGIRAKSHQAPTMNQVLWVSKDFWYSTGNLMANHRSTFIPDREMFPQIWVWLYQGRWTKTGRKGIGRSTHRRCNGMAHCLQSPWTLVFPHNQEKNPKIKTWDPLRAV